MIRKRRIPAFIRRRPLVAVCLGMVAAVFIRNLVGEVPVGGERLPRVAEAAWAESPGPTGAVRVAITGTVASWEIREKSVQYVLKNCSFSLWDEPCTLARVRVTVLREEGDCGNAEHYPEGAVIRARGKLSRIEEARNPGQFDARAYYRALGISFSLFAYRVEVLQEGGGVGERFALLRAGMTAVQQQYLGEEEAGVLAAITLGERALLTDANRADYRTAGIFHIICISGLHISMLGLWLYSALFRLGIFLAAKLGARRIRVVSALGTVKEARERPVAGRLLLAVKTTAVCVSAAGMAAYVVFVGAPPSALRALLMFGVMLGAKLLGRSYDTINALSLAAILILASRPAYLFHNGFQLSFIAVIGAGVLYPRVAKGLRERKQDTEKEEERETRGLPALLSAAREKLGQGLLLWLCVTAVSLPLVARYYYEIPLWGFLANLLLVPLVGIVLVSGLAGSLLLAAAGAAAGVFVCGRVLLLPAQFLLRLFTLVSGVVRFLPGASWICGRPDWWQVGIYYAGLFVIVGLQGRKARRPAPISVASGRQSMPEPRACLPPTQHCQSALCSSPDRGLAPTKRASLRRRGLIRRGAATRRQRARDRFRCVAAAVFILAVIALFRRPGTAFSLTMLDVGQGDCFVLREQDRVFLVDGGSSDVSEVGRYRIAPYLKSRGIRRIDGIFITHGDGDHISGIEELLGEIAEKRCAIRVDALLMPAWMRDDETGQRLAGEAACAGTAVKYLQTGDRIKAGELELSVLAPTGDSALRDNAGSLVLCARYGELDILLTGDLEGEGEKAILPQLEDIDLLKVSHHGSRNSTTAEFLRRTKPEICLVSAPDGGRYDHPHKETLDRIADAGADCYLTRDSGAVQVTAKDGKIYIETYCKK